MAPKILQETNISSKASKILLPKENLPKGTKDHEREWRERGRRWEKFGHSGVAPRKYVKKRRGRHSFILGREKRPLLDELQVSHIQKR
jgi:hypothetical protein